MREEVAAQLGCRPSDIADDADLTRWGLDSLGLLRLVEKWRRYGVRIGLADMSRNLTIATWWQLAAARHEAPSAEPAPRAGGGDVGQPFELTPLQQAYWIGRQDGQPLGGVGCHGYMEFDGSSVDPHRLETAVFALARRHAMLRARFLPDGHQEILPETPWPGLTVHDLRGVPAASSAEELQRLRTQLSHRRLPAESGGLFDVQLSLLDNKNCRIHLEVDLLVSDAHSIQVVLADLAQLYADPDAPLPELPLRFPEYLAATRPHSQAARAVDAAYWERLLPQLPERPDLPLAQDPARINAPRFVRTSHRLSPHSWRQLVANARAQGITPAMALATAYAEVLGAWSAEPRFLLNLPLFNRREIDPSVSRMVGDFSSLALLPVDTTRAKPFLERARNTQAELRAALSHAEYSGVEVLRDLARKRPDGLGGAPVVFSYLITGGDFVDIAFQERLGALTYMITQTPQVWLDHQVYQMDGTVVLVWDAVEGLFPAGMIDDMFACYTRLVDHLATPGADWSAAAPVALPAHQRAARDRVNATRWDIPRKVLHGAFFERARQHPGHAALLWEHDSRMTYGQLAEQALCVAAALTAGGALPGEVVAVRLPKGPEQVIAVLGVLAAGAAYLPLGVGLPEARQERVLRKAKARWAITDKIVPALPAEVRALTLADAVGTPPLPRPVDVSPDSTAYVIFTSGSTGEPKGVELSHQAPANTIADINDRCHLGPEDRVFGISALDFDLSVYDIFGPLSVGGALVLPLEEHLGDAAQWHAASARHGVTVWNSVPATMEMFLAGGPGVPASMRVALLSGDWVARDLPDRLKAASQGRCRLVALGGATEAGIWSNAYEADTTPPDWPSIPYGCPLRNQRWRVVGPDGRDAPDWVPGELWIGGAGVAIGYRGDPVHTAERFVHHEGQRWYRTGDRVRYRPGGLVEFLGRIDGQVKLQGYRVELSEVEAVLQAHPRIARAVVIATGGHEARHLVAFVIPADGTLHVPQVHELLREQLPAYALPRRVVLIKELPLTHNGKVDRAVLARWLSPSTTERATAPLASDWERQVAVEWSSLLARPVDDRHTDFYTLGGNSLLATRLAIRLRERFGVDIGLAELFTAPTVAAMADLLARTASRSV
jgi:yersiniabactin nonribosomal peptide synthetase